MSAFSVGDAVVYRPRGESSDGRLERGVVTSVNSHYVFVRYGDDADGRATEPADLTRVEHQMVPGSHERPFGPECQCGATWGDGRCVTELGRPLRFQDSARWW